MLSAKMQLFNFITNIFCMVYGKFMLGKFIGAWEKIHNPDFNVTEFGNIKN